VLVNLALRTRLLTALSEAELELLRHRAGKPNELPAAMVALRRLIEETTAAGDLPATAAEALLRRWSVELTQ
jgi:hypothetical protein